MLQSDFWTRWSSDSHRGLGFCFQSSDRHAEMKWRVIANTSHAKPKQSIQWLLLIPSKRKSLTHCELQSHSWLNFSYNVLTPIPSRASTSFHPCPLFPFCPSPLTACLYCRSFLHFSCFPTLLGIMLYHTVMHGMSYMSLSLFSACSPGLE